MELSNSPFLCLTVILTVFIPKLVTGQGITTFSRQWCGDTTYTPNSAYQSNVQAVLNSISSDTRTTNGFYNFTVGHGPNLVSSFALCRGDVPVNTCRLCKQSAVTLLQQVCPDKTQAYGNSGYCSIFISNQSIYGKIQDLVDPWLLKSSNNISNADGFDKSLTSLMSSLQQKAASGNSSLKFATGQANLTGGQNIYGLVQCTPDLSRQRCLECVEDSISLLPTCCIDTNFTASGVNIIKPSCSVRYDVNPIYDNVPDYPLPSPPPPMLLSRPPSNITSNSTAVGKRKTFRHVTAFSIPIGASIIVVLIIIVGIISRKNKKLRNSWMVKFNKEEIEALKSLQFSFGTIKRATQSFSDDQVLGQGGFGTVYKGVLPDGQEVAVKRLVRNSGQGDAEFKNEILILAKLEHKNLVRLLGFCLRGKEMILIYEFVANTSLDNFIFDPLKRQSMLWETRYKIINGIARGILYLHENSRLKIIHRDLKAGNVLLDADFDPKIADFGMARLFNIDQTQTFASKIVGTLGYMAPEYAVQSQVSVKSDVYSFGVLILEIVSGQKITSFHYEENQENLLSFAWRNWREGTAENLVDPVLISCGRITKILRCIQIGLLCVQDNPVDRPAMSSIDLMLSSNSVSLQIPAEPAFFTDNSCLSNMLSHWNSTTTDESSIRSVGGSMNGVTITDMHPR